MIAHFAHKINARISDTPSHHPKPGNSSRRRECSARRKPPPKATNTTRTSTSGTSSERSLGNFFSIHFRGTSTLVGSRERESFDEKHPCRAASFPLQSCLWRLMRIQDAFHGATDSMSYSSAYLNCQQPRGSNHYKETCNCLSKLGVRQNSDKSRLAQTSVSPVRFAVFVPPEGIPIALSVSEYRFERRISILSIRYKRWRRVQKRRSPDAVIHWPSALPIEVRDARLKLAVGQRNRRDFTDEVRACSGGFTDKNGTCVPLDEIYRIHGSRKCSPADHNKKLSRLA
jgi:hypothetical protein